MWGGKILVCIPVIFIKAETLGMEFALLDNPKMPFWYVS